MRARQMEKDGVAAAEAGQYDVALAAFNSAIELCPTRASCYNNRAQLYRLQHKNDGLFARSCRATCTLDTDALHDVDCAVELSGGTGAAATQAYTQRALLHRLAGRDEQAKVSNTVPSSARTHAVCRPILSAPLPADVCSRRIN